MAGIRRSWRRAWGREKPVWQSTARLTVRRRSSKTKDKVIDLVAKKKRLIKHVAASIAAMHLLSGFGLDHAYASNITIDNRTATQVDVNGNVTNIHTDTFRGQNAFNSFKDFNVANGDIVNLHFSNINNTMTATNLLNYVSGGKLSTIDGMLNGIKNGQIGGNVFLLNPYGIMVGSNGVINVGSLTAVTPSQSSIDNFLNNTLNGQGNTNSYWSTFSPNDWVKAVPISADGSIVVQGKVNATNGISVHANDISVSNIGKISSGASFQSSKPDFSDVVNANGITSGTKIAVNGGSIEIIAENNIANSGQIINEGAKDQAGGIITMKAGNDITLSVGSLVSAKGNSANSSGGTVKVLAGNNALILQDALIDVNGGISGDGGAIELSGSKLVDIKGGLFKAGAINGKAGNVLIDPEDIMWSGTGQDVYNDGASYTLQADKSITLNDVVISTRKIAVSDANRNNIENAVSTGDSGDITLTARNIVLGAGTKLLANATNGKKGGNVTLEASDTAAINYAGYKEATASIQMGDETGGAIIKGAKVDLHAIATAENDYILPNSDPLQNTISIATTTVSALPQLLQTVGVDPTYSAAKTNATITIKKGSQIKADDSVSIKAETVSGAGSRPIQLPSVPLNLTVPVSVGVEYATIDADSKVEVEQGAVISAKDLTIRAHNNANLDAALSVESDSVSKKIPDFALALAITDVNVDATANVAGILNVTGNIEVAATNVGSYSTSVDSSTSGTGMAAAAVAYAQRSTNATANLTGDVKDATKVGVFAVNNITGDSTTASTKAGTTLSDVVKGKLEQGASVVTDSLENSLVTIIDQAMAGADGKIKAKQQSIRLSGAVAYADTSDNASATIGGGTQAQTVHATDSVAVGSQVKAEDINTGASAAAVSDSGQKVSGNTTKQSYSAGVAYGKNNHSSLAKIGSNVTITAGKIGVASQTIIPIRNTNLFSGSAFDQSTTLSTIVSSVDALTNTDIFNGQSSAKSTTDESAGSIGMSGSVSILNYNNKSQAIVDTGAKLNLTGSHTGAWTSDKITIDEGAEAKSIFGTTYKDAVDPTTNQFSFDKQADIKATNDTTLLFLGGTFPNTSSGQTGLGMVANYINVGSTVNAVVREGALIQGVTETSADMADGIRVWTQTGSTLANEVGVTANNSDKVISLVTSSGIGSTFGLNGSVAVTSLNEHSYALIDDEAAIKALDIGVNAISTPVLWSISGGFNLSKGASVGVGIAYNDVTGDTKAEIADNDKVSTDGNARVSQTDTTGAVIQSPDIDVEAHTGGNIGAIAVTPTVANSTDDKSSGFLDGIKETYTKLLTMSSKLVGEKPGKGKTVTKPASPSFGLSGAGSAAVNSTDLQNTAKIDNVHIDQSKPIGSSDAASLTVRGTSDSTILAAAGAAAITRANSSSQKVKVGITGSVAANMLGNGNSAILSNSTVDNAGDVNVQALSGGDQVAVAIGMGADASKHGADITFSANGSVSLTLDQTDGNGDTKNKTEAIIENTTINGDTKSTGRDVRVTAYNSTTVGTGGGSFEIQPMSSDATGGGVGAAVTYADVRRDAISRVSNSGIKDVDTIGVNSLNSSQIVAGSGVGSITNDPNTVMVAGAVVISEITNHTTASVDTGSSLTATNEVSVTAKNGARDTELEKVFGTRTENLNYNALGTFNNGGDGIISVAGIVQAGKGPNAGASVNYSEINDILLAQVKESSLEATGTTGKIDVKAASDATILGAAVGVGVSKENISLGGSTSIGEINNSVTASVVGTDLLKGSTSLKAQDVTVDATDDSTIRTLAGQVNIAVGQNPAGGAAVTFNEITNKVNATLNHASINASEALIGGHNTSEIDSIAAAGAVSTEGPAALAGSVTVNFIDNTTDVELQNGALIDAGTDGTHKVTIGADDSSTIQSLAGSLAASGGTAAAGAAVAYNTIHNINTAKVSGASIVKNASTFTLTSDEKAIINTLSAAASGAKSGALSGSLSISEIGNETYAQFDQSTSTQNTMITIAGSDTSSIRSIAGGAAFSGGTSIGAAVAVNTISNKTSGTITGGSYTSTLSNISGLTVKGINDSTIYSASVSGAGGSDVAAAGSSSTNTVTNQTTAGIAAAAITGDSTAKIEIDAQDSGKIDSLSGSVAGSGTASMGAAVSVNRITNNTSSLLNNVSANVGAVAVNSKEKSIINSLAMGGGGAGDVAANFSVTTNITHNTTETVIDGATTDITAGSVGADAENSAKINSLAGAASGAGYVAVGAAAAYSEITDITIAKLKEAKVSASNATNILAANTAEINTIAMGISGSGEGAAVQGAAASGKINHQTEADLENAQLTNTNNKVAVKSSSNSAIESSATAVAGTGIGGGVGAGVTVNLITTDVKAKVSGGTYDINNLEVTALSANRIGATGIGGGVAGIGGAVAGSVAVNMITANNQAIIEGGAQVTAQDNAGVIAQTDDQVTNLTGATAIAGLGAGVGAAVAVNQISGDTTAQISGTNTSVTAFAKSNNHTLNISNGMATDTYGSTVTTSGDFLQMTKNGNSIGIGKKRQTKDVTGVAVNASATHTIESGVGNVSGALFAGVAGTSNVNTLAGSTSASITGAKINQTALAPSDVTVRAEDYAMNFGFAGSVAGGIAGVGGASDTNKFTRNVSASITGQGKTIDSLKAGDLVVAAKSIQGTSSFANGVAGGAFGLGGTASVGLYEGTTEAYVKNAKMAVDNVQINADHESRLFIQDGGIGLGGVGIGAAVGVSLDANTTKAYLENSTVNTDGTVDVAATNKSKIMNVTAAGAGGASAAVGASVSVNVLGNTADAHVLSSDIAGSSTARASNITVKAENNVDIDNVTGSIAASGYASIGASVAVNRVDNTTSAYIADSKAVASNVAVTANANQDVDTYAVMGSVTGGVGLNGNVAVTTIGSDLNTEAAAQSQSTIDEAYRLANADKIGSTQDDGNGGQKQSDVSKLMNAVGQDATVVANLNAAASSDIAAKQQNLQSKTYAGISNSSTIDASNAVAVAAVENDVVGVNAGTVTAGGVSVGAAVGVVTVTHNVESIIDSSTVTAQEIGVTALAQGSKTTNVVQGSAGGVNINATVAATDVTANTTAKAAGILAARGNLTINSEDTTTASAVALGSQAGFANAGAVSANAAKGGESTAEVGTGIVNMDGNTAGTLKVAASRSGEVKAEAVSSAGGIYSGNAAIALAADNGKTTARTADNTQINADNDAVRVEATATPQVSAVSTGVSLAKEGQVGVSFAKATATPQVDAHVGVTNTVKAGKLAVAAQIQQTAGKATSYANTIAAGGGLLLGANATTSLAESNANVTGYIGAGSNITTTGTTDITATTATEQQAAASGVTGGLVALGANIASAKSNSNTTAYLGKNAIVNSNDAVKVTAEGTDNNFASAIAGVGGVVAGSAAVVTTETKGTTKAYIDEAAKIAADNLHINAKHTSLFNGTVDSIHASLVGASGVVVNHTVDTDVLVDIGNLASVITTGDVQLQADNSSRKDWLNNATDGDAAAWNITAAGGGAVNGAAIVTTTNVTQDTAVNIGSGADILAGTANGSFIANADSEIIAHEKARINTGGAISAAVIQSKINANSNNSVVFGSATINSKTGAIKAGVKGDADLDNRVAVDVYGLAGAPAGTAYSNYTGTNLLTIKPNAKLTTDVGDVILATGQDTAGNPSSINANAVVNLWNKTVVPITITPNPQANVISNSSIDIQADSDIGSAQDIYLTTDRGNINATYTGVGKDLYREALAEIGSAISNLFGGGDVNLDIKGGSSSVAGATNVKVDGKVETGIKRVQSMTIDGEYKAEGDGDSASTTWKSNNIKTTDGITYSVQYGKEIGSGMTERLEELYKLKSQYAGDAVACAAYDAEILFLQNKMVAMGLASWDTTGGKKVFVPGTSAGKNTVSPKEAAIEAKAEMQSSLNSYATQIQSQKDVVETTKTQVQPAIDLVNNRNAAQTTLGNKQTELSMALGALPAGQQNYTRAQAQAAYDAATDAVLKGQYQAVIAAYDAATSAQSTVDGYKNQLLAKGYAADVALEVVNKPVIDAQAVQHDLEAKKDQIQTAYDNLTDVYINGLSTEQPQGPTTDYITVNDVTAKLGNIHVKADNLTGSGTLNAPGDASITITNNSPNFLTVNNLKIRDGGDILLNGALLRSKTKAELNAEINALNLNKTGASFADVKTSQNTAAPTITIDSTFNPDAHKFEVLSKDGSGNAVHTGIWVPLDIAPDIILSQGSEITNLNGKVTVHSAVGSIYANGSINAGTVDITASNGDFVQSYVNGFDHIGGDPSRIYAGTTTPGGITANGNIFISARYLNINGLIQSGIDKWTLELSDTSKVLVGGVQKTIAEALADYKNGGAGKYKLAGDYGNISKEGYVVYNAAQDRFEVEGVEVHGGYVQLYGQIMNTAKDGAATGKVRALDGYGTITINNTSSKDVVINKLDTGSGNAGVIDITDVQNDAGLAIHTVYTSNKGVLTTTVNDVQTSSSYTTSDGRPVTTYNPQSGLYYNWTTGTDASKTETYHFESNDVFGFEYSNSTVGTLTSVTYGQTTDLPNGNYLTKGYRPYGSTSADGYYSSASQQYDNGAAVYTKIREWTKRKWWTLGIAGTYYLDYQLVTPTKIITTNTVKASNPVGIEFFGSNSGTINVNSTNANANILLNGSINNKAGTTTISSGNNIVQNSDEALITTKNLNLTAGNNVGSSTDNVRFIVSDTLNATAANGGVNVSQILGDLNLGTVTAAKGTLNITADGNIVNALGGSNVNAQRIELTSTNGTIGSADKALTIQTGFTDLTNAKDEEKVKYGLKAAALGDINITNATGNLLIDTVASTTGDVKLTTPGQMIDNNVNENIDRRTWDQLTSYWDSLQLRAGAGSNTTKQTQTITSFENGKNADYQTYWQLQSHIVDGKYICTDAEKAILTSQGIDTDAFAASQTAKYQQLDTQGVGSWNNGIYDTAFAYKASDAEKTQLLKGSSWTDRELAIALSPGALKQLTDTNPVIKAPNVKGKNVTLNAGGGIGSNVTLPAIDATITPDKLTPEQKVALAAAERADLVYDDVNNLITITQRKPVNIETAGGVLNATSGTWAYLGSENTVTLDQITAGGDVRLKVGGSIINGDTSNYNINGNNVILEAATGGIGVVGIPLRLNNSGTLTARAEGDIFLLQDGDINLDSIYSVHDVSLDAGGSIQAAYSKDKLNIMSKSLKLKSEQVGSSNKSVGISLAADGQLNVETEDDIYLNNISSQLTISKATSNTGNIDISASENMTANNIEAVAGNIKLATGGNLDADKVKAPGGINFISSKDMTADNIQSVVGNIHLNATGNLNADTVQTSGKIEFGAGQDITAGNIESTASSITLNSGGKLTVDAVKAAAGNITVKANGDILNGASDNSIINLAAQNIDLTSEQGNIGKPNKHVTVAAKGMVNAAAKKDINITSSGDFNANKVSSQAGSVNMSVINGSNLHIVDTQVANGMNLRGDNVALDHVIHTGTSLLQIDISGGSKPMADNVAVNVSSVPGVQFNNLTANNAVINAQTDKLILHNTLTGTKAKVANNYYTVVADNTPIKSLLGNDILLRPLDTRYDLLMDGRDIYTNAKVINSQDGIKLNGSASQDTASTIVEKVLKVTNRIDRPELDIAGDIVRNDEGILTQITNLTNLVDASRILAFQQITDTPIITEQERPTDQGVPQE